MTADPKSAFQKRILFLIITKKNNQNFQFSNLGNLLKEILLNYFCLLVTIWKVTLYFS